MSSADIRPWATIQYDVVVYNSRPFQWLFDKHCYRKEMLKSDWICNGWINSDTYIDDVEIAAFRLFSALINWELFANKTTFSIWKIIILPKQNILQNILQKTFSKTFSKNVIRNIKITDKSWHILWRNDFLCDPVI